LDVILFQIIYIVSDCKHIAFDVIYYYLITDTE